MKEPAFELALLLQQFVGVLAIAGRNVLVMSQEKPGAVSLD
jgi:hypothetical protein